MPNRQAVRTACLGGQENNRSFLEPARTAVQRADSELGSRQIGEDRNGLRKMAAHIPHTVNARRVVGVRPMRHIEPRDIHAASHQLFHDAGRVGGGTQRAYDFCALPRTCHGDDGNSPVNPENRSRSFYARSWLSRAAVLLSCAQTHISFASNIATQGQWGQLQTLARARPKLARAPMGVAWERCHRAPAGSSHYSTTPLGRCAQGSRPARSPAGITRSPDEDRHPRTNNSDNLSPCG